MKKVLPWSLVLLVTAVWAQESSLLDRVILDTEHKEIRIRYAEEAPFLISLKMTLPQEVIQEHCKKTLSEDWEAWDRSWTQYGRQKVLQRRHSKNEILRVKMQLFDPFSRDPEFRGLLSKELKKDSSSLGLEDLKNITDIDFEDLHLLKERNSWLLRFGIVDKSAGILETLRKGKKVFLKNRWVYLPVNDWYFACDLYQKQVSISIDLKQAQENRTQHRPLFRVPELSRIHEKIKSQQAGRGLAMQEASIAAAILLDGTLRDSRPLREATTKDLLNLNRGLFDANFLPKTQVNLEKLYQNLDELQEKSYSIEQSLYSKWEEDDSENKGEEE